MLCFGFSVYIQKTSVKQFSHVLVPAETNKKTEREKDKKNYQLQLSVFYIICSGGRWNEKPFSWDYFSCTPSRLRGAELKLDNTQLQCRYIALLIHLNPHPFALPSICTSIDSHTDLVTAGGVCWVCVCFSRLQAQDRQTRVYQLFCENKSTVSLLGTSTHAARRKINTFFLKIRLAEVQAYPCLCCWCCTWEAPQAGSHVEGCRLFQQGGSWELWVGCCPF